uniref:Uncharacterized protein n=1 Tax=Lactuca sativa TaxID=4236 RepID=A0A9R1WCP5_LACSA|nr:hypothetical protein LSAT_V11C200051720 [Lactuca sativa]
MFAQLPMCCTLDMIKIVQFPWSFSNLIEVDAHENGDKLLKINIIFPCKELRNLKNLCHTPEPDGRNVRGIWSLHRSLSTLGVLRCTLSVLGPFLFADVKSVHFKKKSWSSKLGSSGCFKILHHNHLTELLEELGGGLNLVHELKTWESLDHGLIGWAFLGQAGPLRILDLDLEPICNESVIGPLGSGGCGSLRVQYLYSSDEGTSKPKGKGKT